ncbi:MAG: RNA polymerase sigma factor [Actinomycetota bacterium]|nr:RNA polymerase sigma factor [Actinomycetota bacterium]
MISEEELLGLVKRAKERDEAAFSELYRLYLKKVYGFIHYRVSSAQVAEDLTSKVFLKAFEKLPTLSGDGLVFVAWMMRIAANSVTDYYRSKGKHDGLFVGGDEAMDAALNSPSAGDVEEAVLSSFQYERVKRAVLELSEDQMRVILLKYMSGMTNAEVAEVLSKTEGAVKALAFRAVESLGKKLGNGHDGRQF